MAAPLMGRGGAIPNAGAYQPLYKASSSQGVLTPYKDTGYSYYRNPDGRIVSGSHRVQGGQQPAGQQPVDQKGLPDLGMNQGGPKRVSLLDSARSIKSAGLIPKMSAVKGIDSMGPEYYDLLAQQAQKRLRKQYFDDDNSLMAQRANDLKKRGIYGSGIGEAGVDEVYKSFGNEMQDFESQLASEKYKNDLDVNKFNTDVSFKNQEMQRALDELLLSAAGDETRSANDFTSNIYRADADRVKGESDSQARILDSLRAALESKNTDPETRQLFENMFYSGTKSRLGY